MVQGGTHTRRRVKRAILHTMDILIYPLGIYDSAHRQDPASIKKRMKDESPWATVKVILGWIMARCRTPVTFHLTT
jgi:hypothetical protein